MRRFVRRAYLHVFAALVPLGLLVFAARPLLLLLGQLRGSFLDYLPSVEVFAILYLGNLLSVASVPMQTALYAMRLPHGRGSDLATTMQHFIEEVRVSVPAYIENEENQNRLRTVSEEAG